MATMPPIKTPSCLNSSNYSQIPFSLPRQTRDIIAKFWYLVLSETDTYILTNGNFKINIPQFQKISSSTRKKVHPFFHIYLILSQIRNIQLSKFNSQSIQLEFERVFPMHFQIYLKSIILIYYSSCPMQNKCKRANGGLPPHFSTSTS